MICDSCGAENRKEDFFCGMCGTRCERREQERRANDGEKEKCPFCGSYNPSAYKFCGICGARIERRIADRRMADDGPRAVALANARLPTPDLRSNARFEENSSTFQASSAKHAATVSTNDEGSIKLSPAPNDVVESVPNYRGQERVASNSTFASPSFLGLGSQPQSEGAYLLEEEHSSRGGVRKLILIFVLMAIGGLIFLQWRSSHSAGTPEPPKPDSATVPQPRGKSSPPVLPPAGVAHDAGSDSSASSVPLHPDTMEVGDSNSAAPPAPSGALVKDSESTADKDSYSASPKPSMALVKAQRYLQGRGVPRNCEQGLLYLKAATEQNDARAAVQMAALYASGSCVHQDRVKAYRWFTSAHGLQPANPWIETNLNQLWAQMTPGERRQLGF